MKILQTIGMLSDLIKSIFHFNYHISAFVTIIFFANIMRITKKHPLMSTKHRKQTENIEITEINNHTERFSCVKCSDNFCK